MQHIAAPMVGGMINVTLLSLLILPVIYGLVLLVQERFRKTIAYEPYVSPELALEPS